MISVLSVCCCALLNFESFIHGHFLSFFLLLILFILLNMFFFFFLLFSLSFFFFFFFFLGGGGGGRGLVGGEGSCSFKWNKEVLSLTLQVILRRGGLPTNLTVNTPPNHNSQKTIACSK